ncbi:MAG TPA: F0F1 ATP synthase subunit B' [Dongiaceae bacterium]|jgi:F-type H+-transporting ATPase subunit b|nr:F0F1 ATP synthase subunit B' [Dongiaceae bacterium]
MPQFDVAYFAPQLVWLAITFVVLLLLMWRLALPRVGEVVSMREERVQGNLKKAEQLKAEAEGTLADYNKALAEARAAAQAEQNRAAQVIAAETAKREETFGKRLADQSDAAEKRIAGAKAQALSSVRTISADLAQSITQKLVGAQVGADAAAGAVDAAMKERA